ncbi:hypothetical protein CDL12_10544 [Handroanthus impetiginosus]|uniref:Uncharacterized protein n=1 Tax=Handroanthus impetiginosus TaxID=429701 RepID=A0A2G9HHB3_9LAMI|nr:hypothetical protein CDL12_10544 [Handroanthus impetiginosus]
MFSQGQAGEWRFFSGSMEFIHEMKTPTMCYSCFRSITP